MEREELTQFSASLGKEMNLRVYGHDGLPFLAFPTQDGTCMDYEDAGLIDALGDFLEEGRLRLFVVDTVDSESWSPKIGDKSARAARQEQYFHYIVDEVLPLMRDYIGERLPMTLGVNMGANHAAITFLRRPDLFAGVLALSGVYDTAYFFDGWMDPTLYDNAPECFLPNMPADHPYIQLYNQRRMIFCVGQGPWEEDGVRSLKNLHRIFCEKGIQAWCDFWGLDVAHDWYWWVRQLRYFLPILLEEQP